MDNERKLNLLAKKDFVDRVAYAIAGQPRISIAAIEYQVWEKKDNPNCYLELLKIIYDGGAYTIRSVLGTSQSGIFKEIGDLINGGYYAEVKTYNEMVESGKYEQII